MRAPAPDARQGAENAPPATGGTWRFRGPAGIAALASVDVVEADDPSRFAAELRRSQVDRIMVSALGASAHRGSWQASEGPDGVRIVVLLHGRLMLRALVDSAPLGPGDLLVHSAGSAIDYGAAVAVRVVAVTLLTPTVPAHVAALFPPGAPPSVVRGDVRTPAMSAFAAFLLPFAAAPTEPAGGGRSLQQGIADLALAVLFEVASRLDLSDADRQWLLAVTTIEQRLADPQLAPAQVAAALGVSARTLQSLFHLHGTSVARAIRERRVDTAARLLREEPVDPGTAGLALRVGFAGPDQFARAFRSRYGVPPGEYRMRQRA